MSDADGLDEGTRDKLVALVRGVAGAAPFCGGLIAEIVSSVIPGQRLDRIVKYLRALEARLSHLEHSMLASALSNPVKIDLIESGGIQAARALTDKRIDQIAEVVSKGIEQSESDLIRRKRLLAILGEIDDDEVAILNAFGQSYGTGDYSAWDDINRPEPPHLQADESLLNENALYEAGVSRLLRLGLVEKKYRIERGSDLPKFDKHQGEFVGNNEISYLGRMLLREIGIHVPYDDDQ